MQLETHQVVPGLRNVQPRAAGPLFLMAAGPLFLLAAGPFLGRRPLFIWPQALSWAARPLSGINKMADHDKLFLVHEYVMANLLLSIRP